MKISHLVAQRFIRSEEPASKHINLIAHYDENTLLDKSGKLIQIIKLNGLNYATQSELSLDTYKVRRNHFLKSISSEFACYFWEIKKRADLNFSDTYHDGYAKDVNQRYQDALNKLSMFHTEHYLAVITKQPEGLIHQGFHFLKSLNRSVDKKANQDYLVRRHKELCQLTNRILSTFSEYQCQLLSVYDKQGVQISEPLSFLSRLMNGEDFTVPYELHEASLSLFRKRIFFHHRSGIIELRAADHSKRFAAVMAIKHYCPFTYQGILNELDTLRFEYVITQSYRFYDRQVAKYKLRHQQNEMLQTHEESITQTEQIDEAFDEAASGEVGYGKHHFTLICYADNQDDLNKQVSRIVARFADVDIACVREDVGCELGYWAQLPGNFAYIARAADISTVNMAGLASFHHTPLGKANGNHWGESVTILETLSGSPYHFNFHYKDVGNFLVFGAMGSGKTLLVGFLILQSMKFGGKRIIFDKDRGLEIMVRAMGGVYEQIKVGISTGFNPCQLPDHPENRAFLFSLIKKMLMVNDERLTENDLTIIDQAIHGLYRLPFQLRQFCHLASFFGAKKSSSLRTRFDQWHSEGAYAWAFDHSEDSLNINADVMGFDIGLILNHEECKTPILMYLLYRVEQALVDHRGILFIDEGWDALQDEYFRNSINDWSRTQRKKNNIFGLATQVVNDTVNDVNSKAINESAFCKIFFPNPMADKKIYVDELGLTKHEYYLIKNLPDDGHFFLICLGRGVHKESIVARVPLTGLEEDIAVISGRENTLALLDQVRREVGNNPTVFLPLFHERRRML